jgi:RES domain-containing protein
MLVYRIVLSKFADKLTASGNVARWNPKDVKMIYTASSRSLACLENAVHRSQAGLSQLFSVMTINIPDDIKTKVVSLNDLPPAWADYHNMYFTQRLGEKWIKQNEPAILQVPSSIIEEEVNYLLNPDHQDFKRIKVIKTQPFLFDARIKRP